MRRRVIASIVLDLHRWLGIACESLLAWDEFTLCQSWQDVRRWRARRAAV